VIVPKPEPIKPKPPKPEWQANSPEDIRKRLNLKPVRRTPRPSTDVNKLTRDLLAKTEGIKVTRSTRPAGNPLSTTRIADFDAAVAATVGAYWQEKFEASELTGPGREVLVKFVIGSSGRIISHRIVRRSGVPAVDGRVERVLQQLRTFPAPSRYGIQSATYDVEIRFGVKE
jgi:TonB family protein